MENAKPKQTLLGVSDGTHFVEVMKKTNDEMTKKTRDLLRRRDDEGMMEITYDRLKGEINEWYKEEYQKAFNEELEIAKNNKVRPRNFSLDTSSIPDHMKHLVKISG